MDNQTTQDLSKGELQTIALYPEYIYPVKDIITEQNLIYIFDFVKGTYNCKKIFETFCRAGLSPKKITPGVQYAILKKFSTGEYDILFNMLYTANVNMSTYMLKEFIVTYPNGLLNSKIIIPRDILSYGITHAVYYDYIGEMVEYIHSHYNSVLSDEEQYMVIRYYLGIDEPDVEAFARSFLKKYWPFSRKVQEFIVKDSLALQVFVKKQYRITDELPPALRLQAIRTWPNPKLFDMMKENIKTNTSITDVEQLNFLMYARENGYDITSVVENNAIKTNAKRTKLYINLLNAVDSEKSLPADFNGVDESLLLRLLRTRMNKIHWYKMVENMLKGRSHISEDMLRTMIYNDSFAERIVNTLRPELLQKQQKPEIAPQPQKMFGFLRSSRQRGDEK